MAEIRHFPPPNWQQTTGTRARRRWLRRVTYWFERSAAELRRIGAPATALEDLAHLAAKLREQAPD